jgi:hypothetical protein
MAHVLKLNSDDTETELRAKFEALLQKVSPERLLLALCYSGNVRDLLEVAETEPQRPIEHDDMGIADIADGVAEMGARIARERGALGAREAIDRRQVEAMVRNHWNGKQDASPAQIVQDMTALFGQTFMTVEHRRLRALLGLQGKMPAPTEQAPADSQQPGGVNDSGDKPDAIPEDLAHARQGWGKARLDAVAGIGTLKAALTQEFAADDAQADLVATALKRLDELVGRLDDELDATLDAMLREADAERRLALRAAAAAKLDVMDAFVSEDELMTELDGNEILPDMKIVAPLKSGLSQVRAALS